jgi:hypothetical protein
MYYLRLRGRRVSQVEAHFQVNITPGFFFLLGLLFDPEDGGNTYFRSIVKQIPDCTAFNARRWYSSKYKYLKTKYCGNYFDRGDTTEITEMNIQSVT